MGLLFYLLALYTEKVNRLFLYFFPHEKNNHRAVVIQPGLILLLICLHLFSQSLVKTIGLARPGVLGYSSEITADKVVTLTNTERQKLGLPPLIANPVLAQSATLKAGNMFSDNYWAHTSPSGTSPWEFFRQAGYQYSIAGENLAKDFYDTESMMKAWMNSKTHRDNIVNPKYKEIGIGVMNGTLNGIKTTLVVSHFGTPITSVVEEKYNNLEVAGAKNAAGVAAPMISPLMITKAFSLMTFSLVIGVLLIDLVVTFKQPQHRLKGSSLGHASFLIVILLLVLYTKQGAIF